MDKKKITRINELAKKQKSEGLTEEEKQEQFALRREYIEAYKRSLLSQLDSIRIVEPDGTKHKLAPKKTTKYKH
ncbi:MAG: DUF896 domain-containing protein [Clostridia bacterium]|nr:DUF896 domain-containing protein [Clostridia bacterium]